MEQNKTSKYFKYAIGEIILVVIGILMALQINNWNENRKKQALKKSYVTNLINDLNKDTIQLNARLKTNKEKLLQIDSIANLIEASSSVKSLYSHLMSNPTQFGLRVTNTYNANTFNILISSGNIDLFSNNFTNILMELNRLQLAEIIVSEGNSNHFFSGLVHFRNQFVDARGLNNQVLSEAITSNYDSKKYVSLYYNLLITQRHTVSRYIELTSKVKLQTEVLLNELLSSDNL